ncbi:MAG: SDR family oxidoreductase [Zavarzinia sp.]|nr:SDR family oxidoreductase [Zavarzinia sp.]
MARYGTKRDIANACMFLSSPFGNYISGVVLPVDGGWSLGGVAAISATMKKAFMGG